MSRSTPGDIWKRLSKISSSCRRAITPALKPALDSDVNAIPPLVLPVPPDFLQFVQELQLPSSTLQKLASRVEQAIHEQKELHLKKYQGLCHNFVEINNPASSSQHTGYFEALRKHHEKSFQKQLLAIQDSFMKTYEDFQASSQFPGKSRTTFQTVSQPTSSCFQWTHHSLISRTLYRCWNSTSNMMRFPLLVTEKCWLVGRP